MANRLKVQEQQAIRNLAALGWGIRQIARQLGVSRNTVRIYLRKDRDGPNESDPLSTPGSEGLVGQTDPLSTSGETGRRSLCEDHSQPIREWVALGLSAQRIYQDLKTQRGFGGSYQSVKRYVRKLRQKEPKLVERIEVAPGEEVQVDFGTGPMIVTPEGKRLKTWIFRIVLSFSRKAYSEAVRSQNTETFIRCLENAYRSFGGAALTVNLDNLKAAVLKFDWADPELNPKLADFARHYGVTILPCLPATPEHKGKVERGIRYVKENGLAGLKFESLAALNRRLVQWERTVADQRIHGTTKRQVAALFAQEKPALKSLPASVFPFYHEGPRKVHRDGYVEVDKAYYHVPPEYLGREVWVRYDGRQVRIFLQAKQGPLKQIQIHRRLEPGKFTRARGIGGGHGTLHANLDYWLGRASALGADCEAWAHAVAKNRGVEAIRTLMGLARLIDRHSFAAVNQACQRAHTRGGWRLKDVRSQLQAKQTQSQFAFQESHPLIRNLKEYGLFIENHKQEP